MRTLRLGFPLLIVLLVVGLLCIGKFGYQYEMPVLVFPLFLGLFVIVMGILSFIADRRAKESDAPAQTLGESGDEMLLLEPSTWVQFGALLGLLVLCWLLGFIAGIVIFVFVYLWRAGWKPWVAAAYGCGSGFVIWLLFYFLFFTPLPFWPVFMR